MYRILIVEDMPRTREQLAALIQEEIPATVPTTVESASEARTAVQELLEQNSTFDAAIVDLLLPESPGGQPVIHRALVFEVSERMPGALLLCYSAFSDHLTKFAAEYLARAEASGREVRETKPLLARFIPKSDLNYPDQILRALKAHLYGQPIRQQLQDIFGATGPTSNIAPRYRGAPRRGGLTHKLESLMAAVHEHWSDLDASLQDEIKKYLDVDTEAGNKPGVGLRGF